MLFELAMVASLQSDHNNRIVYIAPTKALCAERVRDWNLKFRDGLGIQWCATQATWTGVRNKSSLTPLTVSN